MVAVGVDARRAGWVTVALVEGRFAGASRLVSLETLGAAFPDVAAVAVNLPVVTVARGVRICDHELQALLVGNGDAVDRVPPRAVFELSDLDAARALSAGLAGAEPSERIHALRGKILEVEAFAEELAQRLRSNPRSGLPHLRGWVDDSPAEDGRRARWERQLNSPEGMRRLARVISPRGGPRRRRQTGRMDVRVAGPVVEAHPELSFQHMAGRALDHAPDTAPGTMERAQLLRAAGIVIPAALGSVGGVPVEEILDAAVLAWTAFRYQRGLAESVPPRSRWQRDGQDRIVAVWA